MRPVPFLFLAGNPGTWTGPGNNTYLCDGAEPTLIDAGVGHAAHVDAIATHLAGRPLVRVLVTHGHPDHASGVPALRERWPALEVFKWLDAPEPGWRGLQDGEQVRAGDSMLSVVHTPGHARDHVCFWEPTTRGLYCGDMMTATTTILIPPAARGGSLTAYLESLHRLAAMEPACACNGATTERCESSPGQTLSGPVTNGHCVVARRGGEQPEVNHQSVG